MFYGFHAIAQRILGKETTELEKKIWHHGALTRMESMEWDWTNIDDWLKASKLAPDRKAAVEQIGAELRGKKKVMEPTRK
jgi:hypothetical protein